MLDDLECVKSCISVSLSEAWVEVAHLPSNISALLIWPCGVSELTVRFEELLYEEEFESPVVSDFPFEVVAVLSVVFASFEVVEFSVDFPTAFLFPE